MANICENNLRVRGDEKQLKEFVKNTQTKKSIFTFEKLVPTPKNYLKKNDERWYNWRIKNWGTKWDAYSDSINRDEDEDRFDVSFDTAWSPPLEWLIRVSRKFKKLIFLIHYVEPMMGFEGGGKNY